MFAYISGKLKIKSEGFVIIDVGGIGYKIFMSSNSIDRLPDLEETAKVHTHYYVREDNISLYGFSTGDELRMFELLLTISGVGAKSAIKILSSIMPSEFAIAIISNDLKKLTNLPGIGQKSASRIVLELKDKLKTEDSLEIDKSSIDIDDNRVDEAIAALKVLGYSKKEIDTAFKEFSFDKLTVEDIIKRALKFLGR